MRRTKRKEHQSKIGKVEGLGMECGGAALSMNMNGCTGKESTRGLKHVMLLFQFPKGNQIVYASCLVSSCRVSRKGHVVWLLIVLLC